MSRGKKAPKTTVPRPRRKLSQKKAPSLKADTKEKAPALKADTDTQATKRKPHPINPEVQASPFSLREIKIPALSVAMMFSLNDLLSSEKAYRGIPDSQILFVGIHNVTQAHWCELYAVLKSRRAEMGIFQVYLLDRVRAALALGRFGGLSSLSRDDVLELGEGISLEDAARVLVHAPDQSGTASAGTHSNDPFSRGHQAEREHAEKYPRLRWHFEWNRYVVVGETDGLTDDFVYEFKSTKNRYFLPDALQTAQTQADLYGQFFYRARKRVQVRVLEEGETETIEGNVDQANAVRTLEMFAEVDAGRAPRPPYKAWKCNKCEFNADCPIRRN